MPRRTIVALIVIVLVGSGAAAAYLTRDEGGPEEAIPTLQSGNRWSVPVNVTEYKFDTGALNALPPGQAAFQVSVTGKEPHEFQIFRLADGVSYTEFQGVALEKGRVPKLFSLADPVGGVGAGGGISPGGSGRVVLDLELGRYVFASFVGGDNAQGMIRPFDVLKGDEAPAGDPVTVGAMTIADGAFELPADELSAGMYSVINQGGAAHEAAVFEVSDGVDELIEDLQKNDEAGGVAGLSAIGAGLSSYSELALEPGSYAFVCRLTDPGTGEPYYSQGMVREFEVR